MFEKMFAIDEDQNSSLLSKIAMAMMLGLAVGYVLIRFRRPSQTFTSKYPSGEDLGEIEITDSMIVSPSEPQELESVIDEEENIKPRSVEKKRDRLEKIKGIGPVFANRLYDAGVYTFSDLANASPNQILEIVEVDVDVEDWINQAKVLK